MKIKVSLVIDSEDLQGLKDLFPDIDLLIKDVKHCKVTGCTDGHYALGYCKKHWRIFKDHGDPLYKHSFTNTTCKVPGCTVGHYAKGYCKRHWRTFKDYGDPLYIDPLKNAFTENKEWKRIQAICSNSDHGLYYRYGGRGVTVCLEWVDSFAAFYTDMGNCPSAGAIIDCDSDVFNKDNCRWKSLEEFQEDNAKRASKRFRGGIE